MRIIALALLLTLMCGITQACEIGWTMRNIYGKPNSYNYAVGSDGGAYYFPNGSVENVENGVIWKKVHFEDGRIDIATPYSWCIGSERKPSPEGKEPYVFYKGARWYLQYHGFIHVYEDGHEYPKKEAQ